MANIDKISVKNTVFNIISPAVVSDYIEVIGGACTKPDGYEEDEVILAKQNDVQLLFKATQDIAFGANIVENTNCVRTTLEEVLKNAGGGGGASSADQVSYDNSESGLEAENVQEAVDELATKAGTASSQIQTLTNNVSDINTALSNEVATRAKLGGHNLLPNNAVSQTINGVTFTVNSDKSVTVNGTATERTFFNLEEEAQGYSAQLANIRKGNILSCKNATNDCSLMFSASNNGTDWAADVKCSGTDIKMPDYPYYTLCWINVASGATVNNLTIYPMIRLATDASSDYEPYAMTNQELTPIAQAVSNRNLLDNPWFTVNQRGQASYNSNYTVDRWKVGYGDIICDVTNNGITLSSSILGSNFVQFIEEDFYNKFIAGKDITLSVLLSDGTIRSATGHAPVNTSDYQDAVSMYITNTCTAAIVGKTGENEQLMIRFTEANSDPVSIRAIKLELGSVSTLAQDTAPNYAEELLKCQRYFIRYDMSTKSNGTMAFLSYYMNATFWGLIYLPTIMRDTPTVTYTGTARMLRYSGSSPQAYAITGIGFQFIMNNILKVWTSVSTADAANFISGEMTEFQVNNGHLDLSADL